MSTSEMIRVDLYAGMNWRMLSGIGTMRKRPKGSKNMRKSNPIFGARREVQQEGGLDEHQRPRLV